MPELVRLAELRVRIPRHEIAALQQIAARESVDSVAGPVDDRSIRGTSPSLAPGLTSMDCAAFVGIVDGLEQSMRPSNLTIPAIRPDENLTIPGAHGRARRSISRFRRSIIGRFGSPLLALIAGVPIPGQDVPKSARAPRPRATPAPSTI